MNLDEVLPADDAATDTPPRQTAPDGTWPAVILEAGEVFEPYLADRYPEENPRGQKLVLRLEIEAAGHTYRPRVDVPAHWAGTLHAIAKSAGVPAPKRGEPWDEAALIGQAVIVTTTTRTDAKGREWTRVTKWHERETAADAGDRKAGPATKPARKPRATTTDADDIPF